MNFLPTSDWVCPQAVVPLLPGHVQVWLAEARGTGPMADVCRQWLSDEERQRHGRMRAGVGRDEFLIGRGCLRALLGAVLGREPQDVRFAVGKHGKPAVEGIDFNVSHAHGVVLIALSLTHTLGVDLEWVDREIEALDIARDTFAPREIDAITAAAEGFARTVAFYRCWTRKEAIVKAHGQGLTFPLASFAVSTEGTEATEIRLGANGEQGKFVVRELEVGGGFIGALAVDGAEATVETFLLNASVLGSIQTLAMPVAA